MARHGKGQYMDRYGIKAAAADRDLGRRRHLHTVALLRPLALSAQRLYRLDAARHRPCGNSEPGRRPVRIVGCPQPQARVLADGPVRHSVVLLYRFLLPGREHVRLAGHLQLSRPDKIQVKDMNSLMQLLVV